MRILTGCDLVNLTKFKSIIADPLVCEKLFTSFELTHATTMQRRSGFFAVKEACIKALDIPAGNWHVIQVSNCLSGKPMIAHEPLQDLLNEKKVGKIISSDVSISHDNEYVMAMVCFLIDEYIK